MSVPNFMAIRPLVIVIVIDISVWNKMVDRQTEQHRQCCVAKIYKRKLLNDQLLLTIYYHLFY